MFILFETSFGLALVKVFQEKKNCFGSYLSTHILNFWAFSHYKCLEEATIAFSALVDCDIPFELKMFLSEHLNSTDLLGVYGAEFGEAIERESAISCGYGGSVSKSLRCIRSQIQKFLTGTQRFYNHNFAIALSHSLSRYRIRHFAVKGSSLIINAISLLTDLNKQFNLYSVKIRKWYVWHFPELTQLNLDNICFEKAVRTLGEKKRSIAVDLCGMFSLETISAAKEVSSISLGTVITDKDLDFVKQLSIKVLEIRQYQIQLRNYLKRRMSIAAPNLNAIVGEHIGAKLIAQCGSLCKLAKYPSSTLQIFGAEKGLLRALKTKQETPKHGFVYDASLVRCSNPRNKGKISRLLSTKCSLSARLDALGKNITATFGIKNRMKVVSRLRFLEDHIY